MEEAFNSVWSTVYAHVASDNTQLGSLARHSSLSPPTA
jgi:hypothetical protein